MNLNANINHTAVKHASPPILEILPHLLLYGLNLRETNIEAENKLEHRAHTTLGYFSMKTIIPAKRYLRAC